MSREEKPKRKFTVKIYIEEYLQLCSWVLKHEHIETGGDLFGLWADDRTAVVQLVLGPGKNCNRTPVSFYQDVEYLKEVGSYLTSSEGLCHIGEWHSHHQLGLARPSRGDESTVWNNMPTYGLDRFVIFIANIDKNLHTNVGCFLFERETNRGRRLPVLEGEFDVMYENSPLRSKMKLEAIRDTRENSATKIFADDCENLNNDEMLKSLKTTRDKKTGRVQQVFKERPQHGGARHAIDKGERHEKQGASQTGKGRGHKGAKRERNERSSSNKSQGNSKTTHPGHAKLQWK